MERLFILLAIKLAKIVTSSKNAKAVKVSLEDHKVVEQELETVYLGKEK